MWCSHTRASTQGRRSAAACAAHAADDLADVVAALGGKRPPPLGRLATMPDESAPRIRLTPIPDDVVLVVRGDELDRSVLEADAVRFHRRFTSWGRYGISAFLARDD